jgi:hypothetical protein
LFFDSTGDYPQSTGSISPALNRITPCEIKALPNYHNVIAAVYELSGLVVVAGFDSALTLGLWR